MFTVNILKNTFLISENNELKIVGSIGNQQNAYRNLFLCVNYVIRSIVTLRFFFIVNFTRRK